MKTDYSKRVTIKGPGGLRLVLDRREIVLNEEHLRLLNGQPCPCVFCHVMQKEES